MLSGFERRRISNGSNRVVPNCPPVLEPLKILSLARYPAALRRQHHWLEPSRCSPPGRAWRSMRSRPSRRCYWRWSVSAAWFSGQEAPESQLIWQFRTLVGPTGAEAISAMLRRAGNPAHGVLASVVAFVTLLADASAVFVELRDALRVDLRRRRFTGPVTFWVYCSGRSSFLGAEFTKSSGKDRSAGCPRATR